MQYRLPELQYLATTLSQRYLAQRSLQQVDEAMNVAMTFDEKGNWLSQIKEYEGYPVTEILERRYEYYE